jgi:hypothetical protein
VRGSIETFLRMRTIETALRALEEKSQVVYFRPERNDAPAPSAPPDLLNPDLTDPGFSLPASDAPPAAAEDETFR